MKKFILCILLLAKVCTAQQKLNPVLQINWPLVTGSGVPTSACSALNYGQPYTDIVSGTQYQCAISGWQSSATAAFPGITVSGATVTLPASMGATQTGLCEVRGY